MNKNPGSPTIGAFVFEEIRMAILHGGIVPGARLRPGELATGYGVSLGVVREALMRLEQTGLVHSDYNRGFQVRGLSRFELEHLTEARVLNETTAVRLAVERGSLDWESRLVAVHHRLARTPMDNMLDPSSYERWADRHRQLHLTIFEGGGNAVLIEICERLFIAAELYRRWLADNTVRDVPDEHEQIVSAIVRRDADTAAALYETHVRWTGQMALALAEMDDEIMFSSASSGPTA